MRITNALKTERTGVLGRGKRMYEDSVSSCLFKLKEAVLLEERDRVSQDAGEVQ